MASRGRPSRRMRDPLAPVAVHQFEFSRNPHQSVPGKSDGIDAAGISRIEAAIQTAVRGQ
jgi:hypothetical protein